ncbi:olfactory receptor 5G29-like [Ranitomeya imitator]
MSYDRYVAICNPLHYNIILNRKFCVILSAVTWLISLIDPAPIMRLVTKLPFCKSHQINHHFCDSVELLKLSCGSITRLGIVILIESVILALPAFLFTLYTYVSIISIILKIQTARGRLKAFSTCASHLTVVSMLYVTLTCVYFVPSFSQSVNDSKTVSLLNIVLIPMLNPVLYSLQNKDVKNAFLKLIKQKQISAK